MADTPLTLGELRAEIAGLPDDTIVVIRSPYTADELATLWGKMTPDEEFTSTYRTVHDIDKTFEPGILELHATEDHK